MIGLPQVQKAVLILADGRKFNGTLIGHRGVATGEICFNTGMTGYQEIFTDPSYAGQVVTMTNVHVGNYGTRNVENQSAKVQIAGLVVCNFSEFFSRHMADKSLQSYLEENKITGIADVDTRALVRHIRNKGAMNCIIAPAAESEAMLLETLRQTPSMDGCELASEVSTDAPYFFGDPNAPLKVAVYDYGCKTNILECLSVRGCYLKVFPARASFEEFASWQADGYFLSNGPGDPAAMDYAIETTKKVLRSGVPTFGICLGHQLMALAQGMQTEKLKYGHRGINHPVINTATNLGEITSQNHGFGVVRSSIDLFQDVLSVSHVNLNDNSVEGLRWKNIPAFSVQYHPESSPGPFDSRYLFDEFVNMIIQHKNKVAHTTI